MKVQFLGVPIVPTSPFMIDPTWVSHDSQTPVAHISGLADSKDTRLKTGFWDCGRSHFTWRYGVDELIYILEGRADIREGDGAWHTVVAGCSVFFPKGSSAEWVVDRYVRKLFVTYDSGPSWLKRLKNGINRLLVDDRTEEQWWNSQV